ncbi:hypothetical protein D3C75_917960 [compost metagenome]
MVPHGSLNRRCGLFVVTVSATPGFRNDLFNDLHLQQIGGCNLHCFRCLLCLGGILPQNRRRPVRGDSRINGMLQHQDAVTHCHSQGAAAAAFAYDYTNYRYGQLRHFIQISGNSFRLASFLCRIAGVGSLGIDKSNDRTAKLLRLLHQTQGLAESFRMGAAEETEDVFLRIFAPLLADHCDGRPV